ncbi:type II toxin-antitoxin system VapC family toxin [Bisgaard Taxon 45]
MFFKIYEKICISSVTAAELLYGVEKCQNKALRNKALRDGVTLFLDTVSVYPWDLSVATTYGKLRSNMEKNGCVMGNLDLMIAAHALDLRYILVTNDKAFSMVPGLNIENWLS